MKNIIQKLWVIPALGFSFCTTQVEPTADLPVVSFQNEISPIISANCALSGCHDGNGEESAILTYDDVINYCEVKAGDAHGSKLYEVIRLYVGENAMPPKPNSPLTDEQIGAIYVWILQGAKNN